MEEKVSTKLLLKLHDRWVGKQILRLARASDIDRGTRTWVRETTRTSGSAKGEHREPIAPGSFAYAQEHLDHFNGFYPLPFRLFGKLYPARLSFTQEFYFLGGFGCFSQITTLLREPPAF